MDNSRPLIENKEWFFKDFYPYAANAIYGVSPESINTITTESTFQSICERFNSITVQDIQLAFKTHVQEEKIYTLTRDEFIKPIQKYWTKKLIVISELETQLKKANEEGEKEAARLKFKEEAMQLYIECLTNGTEWTGTPFQAATFAENFAELFTREEKDALWNDCVIEKQRADIEAKEVKDAILKPTARHLFCQEIVKRALKRGMNGYNLIKD